MTLPWVDWAMASAVEPVIRAAVVVIMADRSAGSFLAMVFLLGAIGFACPARH
jgi:hypothetical protein